MAEVFILVGGNVGDKPKILGQVRKLIRERAGIITRSSSVYATESWGFKSELFWNQVIVIETKLNPFEMLACSQGIEHEMGRIRKPIINNESTTYQERTIDIDLLFYNDLIIDTKELTIPHPKIGERRFVLVPLAELAPDKCHPVKGKRIQELLSLCSDQLKVNRID